MAYNKRRKLQAKVSSQACHFDYLWHQMFEQCFSEEYQNSMGDVGKEERIDDVYKDDFSSDDEAIDVQKVKLPQNERMDRQADINAYRSSSCQWKNTNETDIEQIAYYLLMMWI